MALISAAPGTGIDRRTGQVLSGWPHVLQSIEVILSTRIGARVMRRWFGSDIPALLGRNMDVPTVVRFWAAICIALALWEPRFKITKISATGSTDGMRAGAIGFSVAGIYYPRGHLGDFSDGQPKSFDYSRTGKVFATGTSN